MNTPYRLQLLALPLVALLAATIAGCPPWANNQPAQQFGDAKLVPFESADEFLSYFQQQARARTRSRWAWGPLLFGAPLFAAAPEGEADGGTTATEDTGASGTAGQSFSTTNIQEVGVDESDVMKSDGTYFYIARGDTLRIVRADPLGELAEVGRLDLDLYADELYLYGSKLLILAQRYEQYEPGERPEIMIWPPYYVGSNLTVLEVDVADPTAPELTRQIELDGALVDSRLTGGRLILVLSIAPELPAEPTPLTIGLMTLEQVLPKARSGETERHMVDWEDCLHPESPDGYFLTAVVTLDAADIETIVHSVAVVAEAGTIYASPEALYVTDSDYDADDNYRETTEIHKFAFDEEGAARYVASGEVPGRLLNQFSLGEYQEYLRVATHVADAAFFGMFADIPVSSGGGAAAQDMEPPAEFSAVYVLHQTDSTLEVVGAVENIAPGEDLHSARFISDHGFVVTYHKVDPLFVLDLSDPTDPQVVGELVVPGFSDYLHPLDDTHLIGVGPLPSQELERLDQERLAGARFSGEDREARGQLQAQGIDDPEVSDLQLVQHRPRC